MSLFRCLLNVLAAFENILVNDGFAVFGVGNHDTREEFGKYSYNEMKLFFNNNLSKYEKMFRERKIVKNDKRI